MALWRVLLKRLTLFAVVVVFIMVLTGSYIDAEKNTPVVRVSASPLIPLNRRESAMHVEVRRAVNVVLSCLFVTKDFYKSGRKLPSLEWVIVFLASLKDHVIPRSTKVIIFVDSATEASLAPLIARASLNRSEFVELIVVSSREVQAESGLSLTKLKTVSGNAIWAPTFFTEEWATGIGNGANNFRFALFHEWIANGDIYHIDKSRSTRFSVRYVLLSDATDVAFQRDPFQSCLPREVAAHPSTPAVVFTLEDESKTFRNEKYNKRWLSCYGGNTVRRARSLPISCAGVTIGTLSGIEIYTRLQIAEISRPELVFCAVNGIKAAVDQATHNYILHLMDANSTGPLRKHTASMRRDQCAFHGNFASLRMETFDGELAAVNAVGDAYAIVHQYTSYRHPLLMRTLRERYIHAPAEQVGT